MLWTSDGALLCFMYNDLLKLRMLTASVEIFFLSMH